MGTNFPSLSQSRSSTSNGFVSQLFPSTFSPEAFTSMVNFPFLEAALKMLKTVSKAKDQWAQVNAKTGGHLLKILVAGGLLTFGLIVWYFFFLRSSSNHAVVDPIVSSSLLGDPHENSVPVEDEFGGSEF